MATYRDAEDLISVGAYQQGSDPEIDRARQVWPALEAYLTQPRGEVTPIDEGLMLLDAILSGDPNALASSGQGAPIQAATVEVVHDAIVSTTYDTVRSVTRVVDALRVARGSRARPEPATP